MSASRLGWIEMFRTVEGVALTKPCTENSPRPSCCVRLRTLLKNERFIASIEACYRDIVESARRVTNPDAARAGLWDAFEHLRFGGGNHVVACHADAAAFHGQTFDGRFGKSCDEPCGRAAVLRLEA